MRDRDEFRDLSLGLWKRLMVDLFPSGMPTSAQWTNLDAISSVLDTVGSRPNSNHMFFPTGGGMDLKGASSFGEEPGCLALKTSDRSFRVFKPSALLFESVGPELEWSYFWLESKPLKTSGVYEDEGEDEDKGRSPATNEEVVLVAQGTYAPRSAWDANEYQGEPLPDTAQLIVRSLGGGPLVIFAKGSLYNMGRAPGFDAYSAPHAKKDAAQFRQFVATLAGVS